MTPRVKLLALGVVTLLAIVGVARCAQAGELERAARFCAAIGGSAEVVLDDRTRVDCLTDSHAIEVDRSAKWAEAIGQALYYAAKTDRLAAIALIASDDRACRHVHRAWLVAAHYRLPLTVTIIGDEPPECPLVARLVSPR